MFGYFRVYNSFNARGGVGGKCEVIFERILSETGETKQAVTFFLHGILHHPRVHQVIDAMGVPVTHKTERRGSPHKLHLTKTKQLFLQDREHRDRLKEAKDDLAEGR